MNHLKLDANRIVETIEILKLRIRDRFPEAGLLDVCSQLITVGKQTQLTVDQIGSPIWSLRLVSVAFMAVVVAGASWLFIAVPHSFSMTFEDIIPLAEAGANLLIFMAIGLFWLWTSELKMRRARVLRAMNRLREIAHVIDMHQLTKDPDAAFHRSTPTEHSPKRKMTPYQLDRYLDYCSEMLSLISKLGYLYVSKFDDQEANQAASELESLCSGLSRKIWQKIMVLQSLGSHFPEKMRQDNEPPQNATLAGSQPAIAKQQDASSKDTSSNPTE